MSPFRHYRLNNYKSATMIEINRQDQFAIIFIKQNDIYMMRSAGIILCLHHLRLLHEKMFFIMRVT